MGQIAAQTAAQMSPQVAPLLAIHPCGHALKHDSQAAEGMHVKGLG